MTLEAFFQQVPKAAAAFSGGTDSALLLWAAKRYGCDVRAYYVKTPFQPRFEYEDACRLATELNVPMTVVDADILSVPEAAANGPQRCYHCKRALFILWLLCFICICTVYTVNTDLSRECAKKYTRRPKQMCIRDRRCRIPDPGVHQGQGVLSDLPGPVLRGH